MRKAVGAPLSAEPLLAATAEALEALGPGGGAAEPVAAAGSGVGAAAAAGTAEAGR